jgi:hypoxanthine phosphoribosyltransferase
MEEKLAQLRAFKNEIRTRIREGLHPTPLNQQAIAERVETLAKTIIANKHVHNPIIICVLNGAMPFATDLSKALAHQGYAHQLDILGAKSYTGTQAGELSITASPKLIQQLHLRDVIIAEDVCDSGKTALITKQYFQKATGKPVQFISLVDKCFNRPTEEPRVPGSDPTLSGFQIDAKAFIVGYGLDFNEWFRELTDIYNVDVATLPNEIEQSLLSLEEELCNTCKALILSPTTIRARAQSPQSVSGRHTMWQPAAAQTVTRAPEAPAARIESPEPRFPDEHAYVNPFN